MARLLQRDLLCDSPEKQGEQQQLGDDAERQKNKRTFACESSSGMNVVCSTGSPAQRKSNDDAVIADEGCCGGKHLPFSADCCKKFRPLAGDGSRSSTGVTPQFDRSCSLLPSPHEALAASSSSVHEVLE